MGIPKPALQPITMRTSIQKPDFKKESMQEYYNFAKFSKQKVNELMADEKQRLHIKMKGLNNALNNSVNVGHSQLYAAN